MSDEHGIPGLKFRCLTDCAMEWYDPIKPYTKLEYEWVIKHVKLKGQKVLDVGAHHGHYAVLFAKYAGYLMCVEPCMQNIVYLNFNMKLNDLKCDVFLGCAGSIVGRGWYKYSPDGNGRLIGEGNKGNCDVAPLYKILPKANVIKIDIEGGEYNILPTQIDDMKYCHTWIIELHPQYGNPDTVVREFIDRDYIVLKVDREQLIIRPCMVGEYWLTHATIIARSKEYELA